jgi:branched-chain amino acid transport system substrate-binding protein
MRQKFRTETMTERKAMTRTLELKARFAGAALVAALAVCGPNIMGSAQAQDLVIGILVPTTGALAPLGTDMRNGYQQAVKDVPTVKGQTVKLVVEDTQISPAVALSKAQKLVLENRAKLIMGLASSAEALGLNAQGPRLNVPIVTTNSQAVQATGEQCSRYLFRTNPNDAMTAKGNTVLMREKPELLEKKWFVVFHDFVWGQSNKGEFEKIPGVKIVGSAGRTLGTADWSSAIAQIQASGADAIYLALAVGDDMPAFIKQVRSFGLKHFMLPPLGMPDTMLQALGDDGIGLVTGGLFGSWMTETENPIMAKFVKDYVENFKLVPGPQAIQAYAGMRLTLTALEKAETLDTNGIISALETASMDGVIGKISIRKEDHQGTVGTYIAESVKLAEPLHGARVGWKVSKALPWDDVKIELSATGCKGL